MGLLVGFEVAGKTYYGSWTVAASNRAERFLLRAEARRGVQSRSLLEEAVHPAPVLLAAGEGAGAEGHLRFLAGPRRSGRSS